MAGTNNELYHSGTQFKINIYDRKQEELVATFDPWHDNNPFALTGIDVELSYFQVGGFAFRVNDTKDRVVKDMLENEMVVFIEGGKSQSLLTPFISGFTEVNAVSSTKNNLIWDFSGVSKQAIWNYSQIEFQKVAQSASTTQLIPTFNQNMRIDRIIRQVMNSDNVFPVIDQKTLKERGDFNLDVLMGNVNEVTGSIDFKGSAGLLFENLANSAGAIILTNNKNEVELVYPFSRNTGLLLKESVEDDIPKDDPDRTAYIHSTMRMSKSTSTNDGFYNVVIIDYKPETVATGNEGNGIGSFSMDAKDICFQFLPQSTTLSNLAFMLSKKGTGRSNIEDSFDIRGLQGYIVTDDGSDSPSEGVVATFEIPFDRITSVPSVISGFRINKISPTFDALRKHWCILTASGVEPDNTIIVFTDGDTTTVTDDDHSILRRVGVKQPNVPKPNPHQKANFHKFFQISDSGPIPKHTFYTSSDDELYFQDSLSIQLYTPDRPKMTRISAPFIRDHITAQKYAAAIIEYSAKQKIIFDEMTVQIPNRPIFPLMTGYFQYSPFGYDKQNLLFCEVNGVRYSLNAADRPKGIDYCQVQITAFADHFLDNKIHKADDCVECIC